ncbi:MAG: hypothetical protein H7210_02215 [Pyrinomonadaceae bacterium]|nr:hypothetical protein [Phycisphaerales bacterium]
MMSSSIRTLMSQGAIGLSVCVGLHFVLVDRLARELADVREQIAVLQGSVTPGATTDDDLPRAMACIEDSRQRAAFIHKRSDAVQDEAALFAVIMRAAESCNTRIDHMEPKQESTDPDHPAPPPGGAGLPGIRPLPPRANDSSLAYAITFSSDYSSACRFLAALQHNVGYTMVKSLRLSSPAEAGSQIVQVTIETVHFAFDASPVTLDAIAVTDDGGEK